MFDSLKSLLPRRISQHRLTQPVATSLLLQRVNEGLRSIFGPGIEHKAKAISLVGDSIIIACSSSVLASEIRLQEQRLMFFVQSKDAASKVTHRGYSFSYRWK